MVPCFADNRPLIVSHAALFIERGHKELLRMSDRGYGNAGRQRGVEPEKGGSCARVFGAYHCHEAVTFVGGTNVYDSIPPEGGDNGIAAPGEVSSTIWMQSDQLNRPDVTHRHLAKLDQPGWSSLADVFVLAVEPRRRGDD